MLVQSTRTYHRFPVRVIGIDVSGKILRKTYKHSQKNDVGVELMQSNGTSINLEDKTVDLILIVHVFHEVDNKEGLLHEFCRFLKSSGHIVIVELVVMVSCLESLGHP